MIKLILVAMCIVVPVAAEDAAPAATQQVDALGFTLPTGAPPARIVSLSPNLTEILFAIGVEEERVVGVTRFCDYPPEVAGIEKIGGIVDPSIEKVLSLRPDLILATRGNPSGILERLREAGLNLFAFESQTGLAGVLETMETMVEIVRPGRFDRAERELSEFRYRLECLRAISSTIDESERPSVYYYDPVSPDWTAGPGTHLSEAIGMAGGRNVADDAKSAWPLYALEKLVVTQPDLILVAAAGEPSLALKSKIVADLRTQPGWRKLDAVREERLCIVPADWLLRPGPRVLRAVIALGRCIHPDRSWECDQ